MRARTVYIPAAAFAVVMVAGPAFAANWSTTGVGTAAVKANAIVPPGAGSTSGATTSSLVITWSAGNVGGFAGSAAPTGYEVLRGGVLVGAGGCASATTRATTAITCTDNTGLAASTTYAYTVRAIRGTNWVGATNVAFSGTTNTVPTVGTPDMVAASDSGTSSTDDLTNVSTPSFTVVATTGASVQLFDGATASGLPVVASGGSATLTAGALTGSAAGTPHTITAQATLTGTTVISSGLVVTIDTAGPSANGFATTPSGTAGVVSSGDVLSFTFTEPVAPGTLVSGWNGTGTASITVTLVNNATSDAITFGSLTVGSLALGDTDYCSSNSTATANVAVSGNVVTVTLTSTPSSASAGGGANHKSTTTWTSSTANTDVAGNAGTAVAKSTGNTVNF